tara:strand:+ start:12875 stop:14443 length:1569 start_codon:yes stop_codon:yes gene_type:complete
MANTLRIKRRASGGSAGAPSSLENAELAYNESDAGNGILYYGLGTGGAGGSATSVVAIGGDGAYCTLSGNQTISGNKTFTGTVTLPTLASLTTSGNATIGGNLTVQGTTTTISSSTINVDDKNIELGAVDSPSDTTADGGGITLKGASDHTILWTNSTDSWDFSEHVNIASGKEFKINGTSVLSSSTLGSGVTGSSLTSVGTLTSGTWSASTIAVNKGGTGQTSYTNGQLLIGNSTGNTLSKATLTAGDNITITNSAGGITIAASGAPTAGDGIDVSGSTVSIDAKSNGGLVIESSELAVDLGASSITGTLAVGDGGTGATSASGARTALGLAIGSDVQAYNAKLAAVAGLAVTDGNIIVGNGSTFVSEGGATARASLGLTIGTNVQAYDAQLDTFAGAASATATALVALTSTEVAILDGATVTTAELNILDGVTSTASELNILDGVTATTAEINKLDGLNASTTELNIVDGSTSATSTTLAAADRMVINDAGTMVQVALSDLVTFLENGTASSFELDGGTF